MDVIKARILCVSLLLIMEEPYHSLGFQQLLTVKQYWVRVRSAEGTQNAGESAIN